MFSLNRAFVSLITVLTLFITFPMNSSLAEDVPGKFDYYVLALSWQPAFCETRPNKTECVSQDENGFDAKNFVLHGLWPNVRNRGKSYGYCNVPEKFRKRSWCDLPALKLSKGVRKRLRTFMPGSASCLQRHEWYKHGSCSGLSPDEYYALTDKLVRMVSETEFSKFISANIGRYVKRNAVLNAFDKEFGKGSRSFLELKCKTKKGIKFLTEIRIYLRKDLTESDRLKDLLPKQKISVSGRCPGKFKIDRAGLGNL